MLGFYAIRKLLEAGKVPDDLLAKGLRLRRFPSNGKPVTYINYHRFPEFYDFAKPTRVTRDLLFVCNQIVHSYVFAPLFRSNGQLQGVVFNSDRTKNRELWFASVDEVVKALRAVGRSDPATVQMILDPAKGDYRVSVGESLVIRDATN